MPVKRLCPPCCGTCSWLVTLLIMASIRATDEELNRWARTMDSEPIFLINMCLERAGQKARRRLIGTLLARLSSSGEGTCSATTGHYRSPPLLRTKMRISRRWCCSSWVRSLQGHRESCDAKKRNRCSWAQRPHHVSAANEATAALWLQGRW